MSTEAGITRAYRNVSYLRNIDPLEAIQAKAAISQFFGPVQEPAATAHKPPSEVREPKSAMWIIGGGIALVIAAVLSMALREHLPPMMPGLYLGIGGICAIVAGIVYAKLGAVQVETEPTPEKKAANKAQIDIGKQIDHFRSHAEAAFGPPPRHPGEGRRAHLVGIGRKEWNGQHEVPIVEVKGDRIWAGVVHLVSIDMTTSFIAIRQMGLHLATGTVYNESNARYLLTDVMTAVHHERKFVATHAWDRAAGLAKEIGLLDTKANKVNEKVQADIAKKKEQLQALAKTFDEPAGNRFMLTFSNGEKLELTIADCDHPNNKSDFGYPIGGKENLDNAVQMWTAINVAIEAAKDAHHAAVTGVKFGLDEYQKSVVGGLADMRHQIATLEGVMKEVLAALTAGARPAAKALDPAISQNQPESQPAAAHANGEVRHVVAPVIAVAAPQAAPSPNRIPSRVESET